MSQTTSLPRGVHLLHVEENCIYEGERWSVRPVMQVHCKARLTFAQISVPVVNVPTIVQQHIDRLKNCITAIKDLARVKIISLNALKEDHAPNSVNFEEFLNPNIDVWTVLNFVLFIIIYFIGFLYIIRRKFWVKVTKTSERQPLPQVTYKTDNYEANLFSEDYEKENEVQKRKIGTEVIRLYPSAPEIA